MKLLTRALIAILLVLGAASLQAANGTLAPLAYQTVWDVNGNPVSGAKICTFLAGTSTPATTWNEVTLTTPNGNPIIADSAGRFVAYLQTGQSYKFQFQDATGTPATCDGATIKTVDNIAAVPGSAANLDITGIAGETLTAGQAVYLSDGSASKTAGSWYKADSATAYSSTLPETGMAPAAITIGNTGTIRQAGQIPGLTSLTIGAEYFIGTAGAIVATPPANARHLGHADTTTSLVLTANPSVGLIDTAIADGRVTLTTLVPVTTADVVGATSVFYTPMRGSRIALYSGTSWSLVPFVDTALALGTLVNGQGYDVFGFATSTGTLTLELAEWANAVVTMTIAAPGVVTWTAHGMATGNSITFTTTGTLPTGVTANTVYWITVVDANTFKLSTSPANVAAGTFITTSVSQSGVQTGHQPQARQTALVLQDGVYVKTGATTRRYLAAFLTTSTTTTEDSAANRNLSNAVNRAPRLLQRSDATANWNYTTNTYRQANASAANQVSGFIGLPDTPIALTLLASAFTGGTPNDAAVGFGVDSTTTVSASQIGGGFLAQQTTIATAPVTASLSTYPTIGRHFWAWLEKSNSSANASTVTFMGTPAIWTSPFGITGVVNQ